MPFHTRYSRLTPAQHEAIGRVAVSWSVVEFALETILARLARTPDILAWALTNDLSVDNRLTAMNNLIAFHRTGFVSRTIPKEVLDELTALRPRIAEKKNLRNKIVHLVWFRETDDQMFGTKFKGKLRSSAPLEPYEMKTTLNDIKSFADDLDRLGDQLVEIIERMPEIDGA